MLKPQPSLLALDERRSASEAATGTESEAEVLRFEPRRLGHARSEALTSLSEYPTSRRRFFPPRLTWSVFIKRRVDVEVYMREKQLSDSLLRLQGKSRSLIDLMMITFRARVFLCRARLQASVVVCGI